MIEKLLGVVCLIAAGAMYTTEFIVWRASEHWRWTSPSLNSFVLILTVVGFVLLISGYVGRARS